MIRKLAANNEGTTDSLNQKYQSIKRGQTRNFYDRDNYHNRYRSNNRDRRIQFSSRMQYGQIYKGAPRYGQSYMKCFRRGNFRGNLRTCQNQNFRRQNNKGGYRGNYRNENYERGRSESRER